MSEPINTGGPAFPCSGSNWVGQYGKKMGCDAVSGMTLRDYFAANAMPVHMAALSTWDAGSQEAWHNEIARISYATADAMLKARQE